MEFNSIAMIETNGLVSAISALEIMLKLGGTKFLKKEVISNGQVTVFIEGNIPNLRRVLQAGEIAAKNVGIVISSSLIENPGKDILDIILDKKTKEIPKRPKIEKKVEKVEPEKIVSLFDDVDEFNDSTVPEPTVEEVEILDAPELAGEESEKLDIPEPAVVELEKFDSPELAVEEPDILDAPELAVEVAEELDSPEPVVEELEKFDAPEPAVEELEKFDSPELANEEAETLVAPEPAVEESEKFDSPELTAEEINEEQNMFVHLNHLERLRAEAKLEIEKEMSNNSKKIIEDKAESVFSDHLNMNVHELRKLARSNPNFPIKGREISKANRSLLLNYFNQNL